MGVKSSRKRGVNFDDSDDEIEMSDQPTKKSK